MTVLQTDCVADGGIWFAAMRTASAVEVASAPHFAELLLDRMMGPMDGEHVGGLRLQWTTPGTTEFVDVPATSLFQSCTEPCPAGQYRTSIEDCIVVAIGASSWLPGGNRSFVTPGGNRSLQGYVCPAVVDRRNWLPETSTAVNLAQLSDVSIIPGPGFDESSALALVDTITVPAETAAILAAQLENCTVAVYVTIDLGAVYRITGTRVWRYLDPSADRPKKCVLEPGDYTASAVIPTVTCSSTRLGGRYCHQKTALSTTGLFDGEEVGYTAFRSQSNSNMLIHPARGQVIVDEPAEWDPDGELRSSDEVIRIDGLSCDNARYNQLYVVAGVFAVDDRTFYRGLEDDSIWLYHSHGCGSEESMAGQDFWMLSTAEPDDTYANRQRPSAMGCNNEFKITSDALNAPLGTFNAGWQWCGAVEDINADPYGMSNFPAVTIGLNSTWVRGPFDSNSAHQLLLPPANWCPMFAYWTTQGDWMYGPVESAGGSSAMFPTTSAQFVRVWAGRSDSDSGAHLSEIDVYGLTRPSQDTETFSVRRPANSRRLHHFITCVEIFERPY